MKKFLNFLTVFCLIALPLKSISQTLTFSSPRGFYTSTFQLTITKSFVGGNIRYTTNGTPPTTTSGTVYSGPITINTTTVVRAIGYDGGTVTPVTTNTYLFLEDVIEQPENISGWPINSYDLGDGGTAEQDYEMDPDVVNDPAYSGQIIQGLQSIPSMSIVMDKDDFWEAHDNEVENPCSVEILYHATPSANEQFNLGFEGHSWLRLKRSFRLEISNQYATEIISTIFKNGPLNGDNATDKFDHNRIVLRAGNNRSWARNWRPDRTCYTRDEWYRNSLIEVSGIGSHGTFVHLYINGIYWGLYNPVERLDAGWEREYMGGAFDDWFGMHDDGIDSGDDTRYQYFTTQLIYQDMSIPANYEELKQYLDVEKYAEYLMVSWFTGMSDWPGNNFYGGNRNTPPGPHMYYGWDCEWSWDNAGGARNGADVHNDFKSNVVSSPSLPEIAEVFHAARQNDEFMMLFADRVYKHCFNGGALTDDNSRARWQTLNNFISTAIIAESARWGDAVGDGTTRTKNDHWTPEINRVDALMNGNVARFLVDLRGEGYYPTINPPTFNQEGGNVSSGFTLTMSNPNGSGTIYYTTNGIDPREVGGGIAAAAQTYSGGIPVGSGLNIKARIKTSAEWSALHEGNYVVNSSPISNLFINEFVASNSSGLQDDAGEYEDWIEIYNANPFPINLAGLYITDDLTNPTKYKIPSTNLSLTNMPAGGFKVLWADEDLIQGVLHVNIKLSAGGEGIGLVQLIGGNPDFIDSLTFGAQAANISSGRFPDGATDRVSFIVQTPSAANADCNGVPTGMAAIDNCGVCAGGNTGIVPNSNKDQCGVCNGGNAAKDCNNVCFGTAAIDNCGVCAGGTTGIVPGASCTPTCVQNEVVSFTLMHEGTTGEIGPLTNGMVINLASIGDFSIRANVCSTPVGSVKFILNGTTKRTETTPPYAINGDSPVGSYTAWNVSIGSYILIGRPYTGSNGTGTIGVEETVSFTVINQQVVNDCNGIPNGTAAVDDCGVCNGGNAAKDCNGICFGTAFIDGCGTCVGGTTGLTACTIDCNGVLNGTAAVDDCGVCAGGTTGIVSNSNKDACGVCNGGNAAKDCNGICFGTAFIDGCATCVGGNTGLTACTIDCNGVINGSATLDDCGVCAGGNTGVIPNVNKDACGVCNGGNAAKDCNNVCFGTAAIDNCGICAGGTTGLIPGASCAPPCVQNEVVSFTLMHAGTGGVIGLLTNGMVINLFTIGSFSIRANVCSTPVGSVKFILNGTTKRTETGAPYAINGDSPVGNYTAWNPTVGSYTLIGKPYTGSNGTGTSGVEETVTFTVVNQNNVPDCNGVLGGTAHFNSCGTCVGGNTGLSENTGKDCSGTCGGSAFFNACNVCIGGTTGLGQNAGRDCNNVCNGTAAIDNCGVCSGGTTGLVPGASCAPPCVQNEVVSLTLVHEGTAGVIGPLTNGTVINLSTIGDFSIRADVCSTPVGSVKFTVNGKVKRMETGAPYAINGDSPVGSYTAWEPNVGSYTLIAKPYTGANGNGTGGIAETVTFTVINGSSKTSLVSATEKENTAFAFEIYPNPNNGNFNVMLNLTETSNVSIRVFNSVGQTVYNSFQNYQEGEQTENIDLSNASSGIYLIELRVNGETFRKKIVVRN